MPFICLDCGKQSGTLRVYPYRCRACGGVLYFTPDTDVERGLPLVDRAEQGVWRFWRLLPPVEREYRISLGEGGTFLHRADRLGRIVGLRRLYLKNEATNPSGSFTDRGMAVEVSYALSLGYTSVACFSRGNTGVSAAAYAAKAGIECRVYTSPQIERGKLYQLIAYDAKITFREKLPRSEIKDLMKEHIYFIDQTSPYFLSGLKTLAYELAEQVEGGLADVVVVPVGDGGNLSMLWQALKEMRYLGLLGDRQLPRLVAVQSKGCMPLVEAFRRGTAKVRWSRRVNTFFHDIASPNPTMGEHALKAVRESRGIAVAVSDEEIIEAARQLAKTEGLLAEPAAASTVAAVKRLVEEGTIDPGESVVCIITGSGLKEPVTTASMGKFQRTVAARTRLSNKIGRTKTLILRLLAEKPMHGYGLMKILRESYGVSISMPSIYQHLAELVEYGLVDARPPTTQKGRRKILYELTITGRRAVQHLSKILSG